MGSFEPIMIFEVEIIPIVIPKDRYTYECAGVKTEYVLDHLLNPSIKIHYEDPAIKVTLTYDRKELIDISALMIIYSLLNIKRVKIQYLTKKLGFLPLYEVK